MINEKIVKTREHSKGSDGSYDTIYRETLAELVKDKDGKTAQEHIDASVNAGAHGMRYDNDRETIAIYNAETETWKETSAGRLMAGHDVEPEPGTVVTAEEGAEVFNDYSERLYDENGKPTQGNVASGIRAHAEGGCTTANGPDSHAEGWKTTASGNNSHAEGWSTTASGEASHAEGYSTVASGNYSHAEGSRTTASELGSHAEGYQTTASGQCSHAEGWGTTASGGQSHAEGYNTTARDYQNHAAGRNTYADSGYGGRAVGNGCIASTAKNVFKIKAADSATKTFTINPDVFSYTAEQFEKLQAGYKVLVLDAYYLATKATTFTVVSVDTAALTITVEEEVAASNATYRYLVCDQLRISNSWPSFAEGFVSVASGICSHAEGRDTTASGDYSHAEGQSTTASRSNSHAEGWSTTASGDYSHAEGQSTTASGSSSHAEGRSTTASRSNSHAEGWSTTASGDDSHAEGQSTTASGSCSHAEGRSTKASGSSSHAEGDRTTASGSSSHAEGWNTTASGDWSHAEGEGTIASGRWSHAGGRFNVDDSSAYFIIGKGSSNSARANAFRITYTGTVYATGSYQTSGADYAEWFEWEDGNPDREDRRGLLVTMNGEKIRVANAKDEFILGVVSAFPGVIGNAFDDQWQGMYVTDIFGTPVVETVEHPDEIVHIGNEEDGETYTIPGYTADEWKLNPDYDSSQPYTPRSERNEWSAVGMVGQLVTIDDGTCEVNGWAKPADQGIVTTSETRTKYRVIARLDETHVKLLVL